MTSDKLAPWARVLALLPGVSPDYVRSRFSKAGGDELESGKFWSPESSAALAANALGWFHDQPGLLPPFPGTELAGWPALSVDIECSVRFPWRGGRHPWLDALIETQTHIIGVESKRHEPFRDRKKVTFSDAYSRPKWGKEMGPFERMRDGLKRGELKFVHLDATQLVKHALGLHAEADRKKKKPILAYVYAEPSDRSPDGISKHRTEVSEFARATTGAKVTFASCRWKDWVQSWRTSGKTSLRAHADLLLQRFGL